MIRITKREWKDIPNDYKGEWNKQSADYDNAPKDWVGRKFVMSGSISEQKGKLLTEGVHFEIV